ncbi:MAG: hypothetical protein AABX04_03095 [Nanoarchaeota archaeon]
MKEKLEKILNSGKRMLAGAGLISLLSMPIAVGCGSDNGDDGGNNGYQSTYSTYNCSCKGDGLFTTMKVNDAASKSEAESYATNKCRGDYPETGCSCSCTDASSGGGGNSEPPCTDECSPHFALKCDYSPDGGEMGTWKCQENGNCLNWVYKGTNYQDDACNGK